MNTQQAKKLSLFQVLLALGLEPLRSYTNARGETMCLFHSPFRTERTPSFWLNRDLNIFNDFGQTGGNILDFAMTYWDTDLSGALKHLEAFADRQTNTPTPPRKDQPKQSRFQLVESRPINQLPIKQYIAKRGIPLHLALKYLKEVEYLGTGEKPFTGIGMGNASGGFEVRSYGHRKFHTCLGPKDITHIKGRVNRMVNVFESAFDFLSFLVLSEADRPDFDSIVLHSTAHVKKCAETVEAKAYRKVRAWLDNDEAGDMATQNLQTILGRETLVFDKRKKYAGHKDLNDFLIEK